MDRPIYNSLVARSSMYWGTAPKYNEEYRKLRWAHLDGNRTKPVWKTNLAWRVSQKANGNWNRSRVPYEKKDLRSELKSDVHQCLRENIPIKTKSLEYKPSDQFLYVKGHPLLKYSIEEGIFEYFCYHGAYDKLFNFILRLFNVKVTKEGKDLVWKTRKYGDTYIDLNEVYKISDLATEGITIVNHNVRHETISYRASLRESSTDPAVQAEISAMAENISGLVRNENFTRYPRPTVDIVSRGVLEDRLGRFSVRNGLISALDPRGTTQIVRDVQEGIHPFRNNIGFRPTITNTVPIFNAPVPPLTPMSRDAASRISERLERIITRQISDALTDGRYEIPLPGSGQGVNFNAEE